MRPGRRFSTACARAPRLNDAVTNPAARARYIAERTLAGQSAERVFASGEMGVAKPDPELYLKPARDAGIAPEACAVVDDSATGCTAGVRAGMRTMGFAEHNDGARLKAVGAEPFHRMADLPGLLGL